MEQEMLLITEDLAGQRLDKVISQALEDLSRSFVQTLIKDQCITVNGKVGKANYKCKLDDQIEVTIPEPEALDVVAEEMDLDIAYEDDYVIVVNKPSNMVVHPAPGSMSGTLVNGLMSHVKDLSGINGVLRPGIVHRIDKDTSGLLMIAKNDIAHESLVNQLVEKSVTRKYVALVYGEIPHDTGTIDAPVGRDPKDRKKMTVIEGGKHAVTHFKVIERFAGFTLIECRLETGRTHQIRVHMKYIGYPLVGDPQYGPRKVIGETGQFLHAATLGFVHPKTNEYVEFSAPLPDYFTEMLESLRNSNKL
ncbi:MAG TPA: RluA family pseudouridine synthase [Firmicutes bacterium]|nr:RluA family pseudouridine synthase [Bacillota bacterium]